MKKNTGLFKKELGERLADIREHIRLAKEDAPLASPLTQLMGASKMQPTSAIEDAIKTGLLWFGENRVGEAMEKWPPLKTKYPDVKLHLIGPLQTNKVKDAVRLFDGIQSVDREKLVDAIAKEMNNGGNASPAPAPPSPPRGSLRSLTLDSGYSILSTNFFIQVNTGEEKQKGGVLPKDAGKLIEYTKAAGLSVVGLMCIPPENDYPAPHFALLRKIALEHNLKELSMGMSSDYELAARMGATIVRVGSALFGSR